MQNKGDALIGYTGFVGSNILAQRPFDFLYNSKNIGDIQNKTFNLVICAGAPGTKWIANKNPEQDLAAIESLITCLKTVKCEKFVLISTIDAYFPCKEVDEDTAINKNTLQPYAKHRRMLEEFVEGNFNALIIRLPGLFGDGLKKNVIYDLIHGSTGNINPDSVIQFYWLKYIWQDISKALEHNLKTVNFATEPLKLQEIIQKVFKLDTTGQNTPSPAYYDMRTKYSYLWGMDKPYLCSKEKVLEDMKTFADNPTRAYNKDF